MHVVLIPTVFVEPFQGSQPMVRLLPRVCLRRTLGFDVRAWKDADYCESLSAEELAQLPENPVGMIELSTLESSAVQGGPQVVATALREILLANSTSTRVYTQTGSLKS